jgi:mono/diheme cytochrome c family protein
MLPALSVIGALTLIGLALFVGGLVLRRLPSTALVLGALIVGFGLGIPAIVIDDNRTETGGGEGGTAAAEGEAGGTPTSEAGGEEAGGKEAGGGASAEGKLIFTQSCGTCHVLKDAGTSGQVGPPLDTLKPNKSRVLSAIEKGGVGSGAMPAGIVSGKDAEAVAEYVASVAGK